MKRVALVLLGAAAGAEALAVSGPASAAPAPMSAPALQLRGGGSVASKVGGFTRTESFGDMDSPNVVDPNAKIVFGEIRKLMESEGLSESAIRAFQQAYESLVRGDDGMISEISINPASDLPTLAEIKKADLSAEATKELLEKTVVLKLNGGLGTGMGLEQAKSLLKVKGEDTFLEIIAKQVKHFKETKGSVKSMFMNSFSTSADTKEALKSHPDMVGDDWEVVQNKVPKIEASSLRPAKYPPNPAKEWCPPGHGDLYPSLAGSGALKKLIEQGKKYLFVSNSDNLGATLDLALLNFFAESDKPFMMEVCSRTPADNKGGHLAVRKQDGQMLLRESAQCPPDDEKDFQDVTKHKYFNTNNLWIRLDKLQEVLDAHDGVVPLPMIKNSKTVDPGDGDSAKVFQLETAMGAAIESFKGAGAIVVDRTRFAPVKTCADLLRVRSDAYEATEDHRLVLSEACQGRPPVVDLDKKVYKKVQGLDKFLSKGALPSLKECKKLSVKGKVILGGECTFKGEVTIVNPTDEWKELAAGVYEDTTVNMDDSIDKMSVEELKEKVKELQVKE